MKHDTIRWTAVDRENLIDVLLGEHEPVNAGRLTLPEQELRAGKVAVGYPDVRRMHGYAPPSLMVIADESATETFSWLRTYAGEVFPLSQYARVVLASEWSQFQARRDSPEFGEQRSDRWASVAVGEALCQVDGETDLQNLPLSRIGGCFSAPVARAALLWGHNEATRHCVDRLRILETDRRFGRRSAGVEQLLPVWSIAGSHINEHVSPSDAATLVLDAADRYLGANDAKSGELASLARLRDFPGLSSDSVEERVGAFNRLTLEVLQQAHPAKGSAHSNLASVALAAAALLVGRSTSHVFLLQRTLRFAPTAPAWFGAMAALAGPRIWDAPWLKAVKGAERLLRPEFNWLEVPTGDVCWSEFAWLAGTFDGPDVFLTLPKMLPRTLNIEIVPGATCQFRIAGSAPDSDSKQSQETTARERALFDAVGQFVALAQRVRGLVERTPSSLSGPAQQSLGLDSESASDRNQRTRKTRRDSGGR